jgi:hypothetical protein
MRSAVQDEVKRSTEQEDLYDHQRAINDAINTPGFTGQREGMVLTDDQGADYQSPGRPRKCVPARRTMLAILR